MYPHISTHVYTPVCTHVYAYSYTCLYAATEQCFATTPFPKGVWDQGCRVDTEPSNFFSPWANWWRDMLITKMSQSVSARAPWSYSPGPMHHEATGPRHKKRLRHMACAASAVPVYWRCLPIGHVWRRMPLAVRGYITLLCLLEMPVYGIYVECVCCFPWK